MLMTPASDLDPVRVGVDTGMKHVGGCVQKYVYDSMPENCHAGVKLGPVPLVEHRLHGDQVLAGEVGDLSRDHGYERAPGRKLLEVAELVVAQIRPEQVADPLGIEQPQAWRQRDERLRRGRLTGAECPVQPHDHRWAPFRR